MLKQVLLAVVVGGAALLAAPAVKAQQKGAVEATPAEAFDSDIFFFGGRYHTDYFGQSFAPWMTTFEDNYMLGGGYQQFFYRWGVLRLGAEVGVADRFSTDAHPAYGATNSGEVWAGVVGRFDGFDFGPVHITPALTAGFSVVSGLIGVEAMRNSTIHADPGSHGGTLLYYLGPEVSFSMPATSPNLELFWRAQHRSGGFGSLANLDGANADTVGVRWKF